MLVIVSNFAIKYKLESFQDSTSKKLLSFFLNSSQMVINQTKGWILESFDGLGDGYPSVTKLLRLVLTRNERFPNDPPVKCRTTTVPPGRVSGCLKLLEVYYTDFKISVSFKT